MITPQLYFCLFYAHDFYEIGVADSLKIYPEKTDAGRRWRFSLKNFSVPKAFDYWDDFIGFELHMFVGTTYENKSCADILEIAPVHNQISFSQKKYSKFILKARKSNVRHWNNHLIDIFSKWTQGIPFNWAIELDNNKKKWAYLHACSIYSSYMNLSPKAGVFTISPDNITDELTFFIRLGEVFIGSRGYVGSNVEALRDILGSKFYYDFNPNQDQHSTLIIEKIAIIEQATSKSFIRCVISLLEEYGVKFEY
jgi:hypothetical protein